MSPLSPRARAPVLVLEETLPRSYRLLLAGLTLAAFLTNTKFIGSLRNNVGPFEILGALLIVSFFVSPRTQRPLRFHLVLRLMVLLMVIAACSQINISEGRAAAGIVQLAILIFLTLFLIATYNLMRQYQVSPRTLLQMICYWLLIVGPWIITRSVQAGATIGEAGPFRNRAHMASYMLTAFWIALMYSQWPGIKNRERLVALAGAAMSLYAIAVAGRRSVYLSLIIGLLILAVAFVAARRGNRRSMIAISIFVVGLLYAMYQYGPRYLPQLAFFQSRVAMIDDRLESALGVSEDEAAEFGFFALQRQGVRMAFEAHPLLGIGWGGFPRSIYSPTGHEVHSTPLRFLAETGLAGALLYAAVMLTLLLSVLRSWHALRRTALGNFYLVLAAGYSSLLVSYLYNRHITERTFWLLLLVILSSELYARRIVALNAKAVAEREQLPAAKPTPRADSREPLESTISGTAFEWRE